MPKPISELLRSLHAEVKEAAVSGAAANDDTLARWRRDTAVAARHALKLERTMHALTQRHKVERRIMLEEMRLELVFREASSARTAERFRVLSEKPSSRHDGQAFDRAMQAADTVEKSIRALSGHFTGANSGCARLQADS